MQHRTAAYPSHRRWTCAPRTAQMACSTVLVSTTCANRLPLSPCIPAFLSRRTHKTDTALFVRQKEHGRQVGQGAAVAMIHKTMQRNPACQ